MTEIYLHFIFAHYGLYGNAPVFHAAAHGRVSVKGASDLRRASVNPRPRSTCSARASALPSDAISSSTADRAAQTWHTGACTINRPCAQQYVGKSQSSMVTSGQLFRHAPSRFSSKLVFMLETSAVPANGASVGMKEGTCNHA